MQLVLNKYLDISLEDPNDENNSPLFLIYSIIDHHKIF
jgi:hypothetical protein